jgi:thioredoxin
MKRKIFLLVITLVFNLGIIAQTSINPEHLTLETFKTKIYNFDKNKEWKYEGNLPAIIDFYADWCRPCRMVAPILDELSKEYQGKIVVYKVDTQVQQQLAGMLGIQSLPSVLFVPKDGKPQMSVGALPKASFVQYITEILKVSAPK